MILRTARNSDTEQIAELMRQLGYPASAELIRLKLNQHSQQLRLCLPRCESFTGNVHPLFL